jgi:cytochrome P450
MRLLQRLRRVLGRAAAAPALLDPHSASAATIDLGDPAVARDPFPFYEALRPAGPVQWLPRNGAWIVLGHDAVKDAFARPEHLSNAPYRPVVGGFSLPVSRAVAAELIGFDRATLDELLEATGAAASAPDPMGSLIATLHGFAPRAAVYRQLLKDGEGLIGEAEAQSLVGLLWLASTTTTERVIAHSVLRLVQQRELQGALVADTALLPPFIEEVMRLHPPEHLVPRLTAVEMELAGTIIPAGAVVHLCLGAANRDPAHYDDPGTLRLDRAYRRHFGFGGGIHHCVGAPLARRVVAATLTALLRRSSAMRLRGSPDEIPWFASMTALSPSRLDIAL